MGDIVQEILDRNKNKSEEDLLSDIYSKANSTYEVKGPSATNLVSIDLTKDKPKKKVKKIGDQDVVSNEDELPMIMSNQPYHDTYIETDNVLKSSIVQLDIIANDVKQDLDDIRGSKTMKKKYDYITGLTSSLSTIIGSKISAARELNNTIKNCHELELKRAKEQKVNASETDDTKAIMDMYNAFISTPVSSNPISGYSSPLGPVTSDLTLLSANSMYQAIGANPDAGYHEYLNNMSPEQRLMLAESDPNIKQVVVYDPATGSTQFKMMNTMTREFLDLPTRDNSFLAEGQTTLDLVNLRARNINLDESYDIVVLNSDPGMQMY